MGRRVVGDAWADEVDRAVAAARRAVGRLGRLLGDEDEGMMRKAAVALEEIGPFAIGPISSALRRAKEPRHRLIIMGMLMSFAKQARGPVSAALSAAVAREKDPHVRARAGAALSHVIACGFVADAAGGGSRPAGDAESPRPGRPSASGPAPGRLV
jgi:hypothetical protein